MSLLSRAILLFVLIGVGAFLFVNLRSCQGPSDALDGYARGTLIRLTALESPPALPGQSFVDVAGREMRLSDYRGRPVLLNVWATWCPPCVVELPMLAEVREAHEGIEVVTIAFDSPEKASAFLEREGLALPGWVDESYTLTGQLDAPGLPLTVLYDRGGREIGRVPGEVDWTAPEASALLDYLAAQ